MKVVGNEEHDQKKAEDDDLLDSVKSQAWFQDHRERFWVVNEDQEGGVVGQPLLSPTKARAPKKN